MSLQEWRVAGASVCGSSHESTGLPCQDAHLWAVAPKGVVIAAVADGAGCASFADVGSRTAVGAAVDAVFLGLQTHEVRLSPGQPNDQMWGELLIGAMTAVRKAIEAEANARSLALHDLATTLTLVAAGEDFVAAVQVGDGAVVAADADGRLLRITEAARGEYLNETVFVTSEVWRAVAQPTVWRGRVAHLALLSDGLQLVALRMPGAEPHPGFFTPLFHFLETQNDDSQAREALASFLVSPRLRERTDDDVTLLLATLIH